MSTSPHLDWAQLSSQGVGAEVARNIVARREALRITGAEELLTLNHLAERSGVPWKLLHDVVSRKQIPYQEIHIPKRNGGTRVLHAPLSDLKQAQRWILDHLLPALGDRHPDSYAYESEVSTIDCAKRHVGAEWLLKADLHNFFPSVFEHEVFRLFRGLNYSPLLSFELARICTVPRELRDRKRERESLTYADRGPYPSYKQGRLPQGSPTSGAIANAVARTLDMKLSDFALRNNLVYTRYSDDLVFSGSGDFSRVVAAKMLAEVRRIVTASGFVLHQAKTKVVPPGARKVVLGVLVDSDRVRILPEQRRTLEMYLHAVRRYGLLEFISHRGFDSPVAFLNHVAGWASYLYQIDPSWVRGGKQDGIRPSFTTVYI